MAFPHCPSCKKDTLEAGLTTNPHNKPISYHCVPCKKEFYICPGGELLTHSEIIKKRRDQA